MEFFMSRSFDVINWTFCYLLIISTMTNQAMATNTASDNATPPSQYSLRSVTISVNYQTSYKLPGSYQIVIQGDGTAVHALDSNSKTLKSEHLISEEKLLELLNGFYQARFFDLPDNFLVTQQVLLQKGIVSVIAQKKVDAASTRLCLEIGEYKKCVNVADNQPAEVAQLVKKIQSLFVK